MPLSQFVQNTRLEQVNNAYLAEVLRMLMTTTVEWGDASAKLSGPEYKWSAATLISHATIQKRVGEVPVLLYDFDPDLRQKMLRPEFYAKVALDVGPKMSTHAAHVLYELGQRYFNDGKGFQSQALPWRQWVVPLTGNADRQVEGLEYKTFMRDVLKPALRDVNDPNVPQIPFTIAIHEQRLGRRVEFIRFIVQPKRQGRSAKLGTKDGLEMPTEDLTLIARAIHLGISQHEAEGIYEKYGPRMGAGLEAMERRKLSEPIANPANYLRKVIVAQPPSREDVLDVEVKAIGKPLQTADTTTKNNLAVLRKRHEESLLNDAEALLNESTAQMRRAEYECFERDVLEDLKTPLQRAWREFRRKDVSSEAKLPMFLRDTFLRWYIRDKGWKALDSDDLLHWGAQRGLVEFRTA
ncbi:Initiator Replication protein (plasmid) [Variovorax sp. PBL-H6]|uniref:RepB family plasmid replication initiator protein n=2 Tax=Variovorax TaxID=34072 RepID=UPI0013184499